MGVSNTVVILRGSVRTLLSVLFQDHCPASREEALELGLFNIENGLSKLQAVLLNNTEDVGWAGVLLGLQSVLEEIREEVEAVDNCMQSDRSKASWETKCITQLALSAPVYVLLLETAITAMRCDLSPSSNTGITSVLLKYNSSSQSQQPVTHVEAGAFGSLSQAIEAFQAGSPITAAQPSKRLLTNSDVLSSEMRSAYGRTIWYQLCTNTRRAMQNELAPAKRIFFAASRICAVSSSVCAVNHPLTNNTSTFSPQESYK